MKQHQRNLDELLASTESSDERERLTRAWTDLASIAIEEPPREIVGRFEQILASALDLNDRRRPRWVRAAALFGVGLLTGALLAAVTGSGRGAAPAEVEALRATALAASLPHRSAAHRLAAVHVLGSLAQTTPATRTALVERVVYDPTPAVQLAAIGHLVTAGLTESDAARMAAALPGLGSPIVQVTLLDLLTTRATAPVLEAIERLARDQSADTFVRSHAERALANSRERTTA